MRITVRLTGSGLRTRTIRCDGCGTTTAETVGTFGPALGRFADGHRTCQAHDERPSPDDREIPTLPDDSGGVARRSSGTRSRRPSTRH